MFALYPVFLVLYVLMMPTKHIALQQSMQLMTSESCRFAELTSLARYSQMNMWLMAFNLFLPGDCMSRCCEPHRNDEVALHNLRTVCLRVGTDLSAPLLQHIRWTAAGSLRMSS